MPDETTLTEPAPASADGRREAARAAVADPARLAAVRATGLLDAGAAPAFDRLTRLAARLAHAPAAFVSVVDEDRDVYVSAVGFDEPLASTRQMTGETFCHYTVAEAEPRSPLVVNDTAAHPVYRDVPTVKTLGVAAYLGVPLVVGGQSVGALCVIDTRPRAWSADEVELMRELADSARRELELQAALAEARRREADTARDSAERRRAADALRQSEERYALAARATHNAIWDWDLGTDRVTWNPGVHEVFGFAPDQVEETAAWWYDHLHPDDRERVVGGIRAVLDTPGGPLVWQDEYRYRRADGAYAIVADRGYVARDAAGRATRMIGAMADVTAERAAAAERERLVAALRASESRLRSIFEQAPIAIAVMEGPEHVYTIVSPRYAESPGSGRPLLGRTVREAFPEVEGTGYFELMDRVYETGEPYFASERRVLIARGGPEPEERFFDVGYQPLRDAEGRVYAIASAAYDITDQVRSRREVEAAREAAEAARREAEKANRARADFLAVMSHELRTPLNAIGGYAELLEMGVRGPVTEAQVTDLQRIQRSQRHLLGLVNEVLNYAKLEAGSVRYDIGDVSLRRTLADAEGLVAPQAEAKGLALTVSECAPDLLVRADAEKLRQVLVNLLSNAVKFTERGAVRVEVAAEAGCAHVRVRDTGIGIPADKLEAVFDPFVQVDTRLTRESQGTGLGLAISRELARGMGGNLTAQSEPGVGSVFTLTLPKG